MDNTLLDNIKLDNTLLDKWYIWYHHDKDNWNISCYKKIYEIKNIDNF